MQREVTSGLSKMSVDDCCLSLNGVTLRNHAGITYRIKTTTNQRVYKSKCHRSVYLWEQIHAVETQKSADGLKFKKHVLHLFYYNCYNGNPRRTCVCKKEP